MYSTTLSAKRWISKVSKNKRVYVSIEKQLPNLLFLTGLLHVFKTYVVEQKNIFDLFASWIYEMEILIFYLSLDHHTTYLSLG